MKPNIKLRDYQERTLTSLFDWCSENTGNPCIVLPTGAGKSIVIAEFIRRSLEWWPSTKVLILTHQKELIEQDAKKLIDLWPEAVRFTGIFSASLRRKELGNAVTFASIQSIWKHSAIDWDVILIDEAHLINNDEDGMYRSFLDTRRKASRVVGLTATPYRLGQGLLTEGEHALFSEPLIEEISILELQRKGYLARIRSKSTFTTLDVSGVKKAGGDYVQAQLQKALNTFTTNSQVVDEIIHSGEYYHRKHWLIFCAGVEHAQEVAKLMNEYGIPCGCVTGSMSQTDREEQIYNFTHGIYTAMTNANILTTGFDYPDIDLIAMLRPTLSPGLYMQMVGRGLRLKSNGGDCLLLDFAGNVETHGPIAYVQPPKARKPGEGVAPCKECPECLEIIHASIMKCPCCGYEFPKNDRTWMLFDGDINGDGISRWTVSFQTWRMVKAKKNNLDMMTVTYNVCESHSKVFKRFFCVNHEGYAQRKAVQELKYLCLKSDIVYHDDYPLLLEQLSHARAPIYIFTRKEDRWDRIVDTLWEEDVEEIRQEVEERKDRLHAVHQDILCYDSGAVGGSGADEAQRDLL